MSDDTVISVENVSKAYRIWQAPGARLKSPLIDGVARLFPSGTPGRERLRAKADSYYRDFYALKDISFQVHKGESVGIIGRNGSGKSTLLQIIASTLQPTTGSVRVRGRVAALLELGSGFNPDFTGRENVYLNAAVLGLSRAETDARFDSIAGFADIGDFIEQPIKTYSSGMMMRLAFAVQVAINPQILIVDEALAVGDTPFVGKCIKWISDFIRQGGTLLFVSHDVGLIKQLTQKCLFLERGHQRCFDQSVAAAGAYESSIAGQSVPVDAPADTYSAPDAPYRIAAVTAADGVSQRALLSVRGELELQISLEAGPPQAAHLVFSIYNYLGLIVVSHTIDLPAPSATGLKAYIRLPAVRLAPGSYRINFAVRTGTDILSWRRNAFHFVIEQGGTETFVYREDVEWKFEQF